MAKFWLMEFGTEVIYVTSRPTPKPLLVECTTLFFCLPVDVEDLMTPGI